MLEWPAQNIASVARVEEMDDPSRMDTVVIKLRTGELSFVFQADDAESIADAWRMMRHAEGEEATGAHVHLPVLPTNHKIQV